MAGLSGTICTDPAKIPATAVERMTQVQLLRGVDQRVESFRDEHCAIVNLSTGLLSPNQPQWARDRDGVLFVEGELFDLPESGHESGRTVAGRLLEDYRQRGERAIDELNGEFTVLVYEPGLLRLRVWTDHLSSRPLFYFQQQDRLVFGAEKKTILALLDDVPTIDEVGLLQLFAHVHNVGDRTFIEGLKRLGPASCLRYQRGRITIGRRPKLRFGHGRGLSYDELAGQAAEELRMAVGRRLSPGRRIVVSLSAGLDSRAVACAMPRTLGPIAAMTRSVDGATELSLARRIAERLGFRFLRENPAEVRLSAIAPLIVWRTEGEVTCRNGLSAASQARMKAHGDFVAGGWFAELSNGKSIAPFMLLPAKPGAFVQRCYEHALLYDWTTLRRIFSNAFLQRNQSALRDAYTESWNGIDGESNLHRWLSWYMDNRAVRMTNGAMAVDSHLFEKFRPFYDRRYLEFMADNVPIKYLVGQTLYRAMIYRLGPEIRDVPDANYGELVYPDWPRNARSYAGQLVQRAAGRVRRRAGGRTALLPPGGGFLDPAAMVRADPALRDIVGRLPDCDLFDRAGIAELLQEHYERGIDHSSLILLLTTVSLTLSYFVDSLRRRAPDEIRAA